ncbi:hypothetical protein EJB05_50894, partial [Eragrostis curvula]
MAIERNKRRHGEALLPIRVAIEWVRDTAFDLWNLLHPEKGEHTKSTHGWNKPQIGWYKCNVDGAFSESDRTGATEVVLRDHDDQFMAGRAAWQGEAHDALMMEARACRDGLQMAQQLGVTKLCLETDCLELINLWNNLNTQRSAVSLILWDIFSISRNFDELALSLLLDHVIG